MTKIEKRNGISKRASDIQDAVKYIEHRMRFKTQWLEAVLEAITTEARKIRNEVWTLKES